MANVADKQPSQVRAFISYSRVDSRFVDRLDADLNARNIQAWVERRKIQGGTDFLQEIQESIERCDVFLLVLSPDMLESRWVRMEYIYALTLNKPIIPLLLRPVEKVPMAINAIQWVTAFEQDYDVGLNELLIILGNYVEKPLSINVPTAAPPPVQMIDDQDWDAELVQARPAPAAPERDLRDLYRAGIQAKARNDLDRTSLYWQQVIDKDAHFGDGVLASELEKVNAALVPIRIERLRKRANQAYKMGAWGEEIGAWEALLKLAPNDEEGEKALAIAEQNQKHAWLYEEARAFYDQKDFESMRAQLQLLYQRAPQFGDPEKLAKGQKLKLPPNRNQLAQRRTISNIVDQPLVLARRYSISNIVDQPLFLAIRLMWWLTFTPIKAVEYFQRFTDEGVHYYKTLATMLVIILSPVWLIPLSIIKLDYLPFSELGHFVFLAGCIICGITLYMCNTLIRVKTDAEIWINVVFVVTLVVGIVGILIVGGSARGTAIGAIIMAFVIAVGIASGTVNRELNDNVLVVALIVPIIVSGGFALTLGEGVTGIIAGIVVGGIAFIFCSSVISAFYDFMGRVKPSISNKHSEPIRPIAAVTLSFFALWISYLLLIGVYWWFFY